MIRLWSDYRLRRTVMLIGVFSKYELTLEPERSHVVLVNPGDMGTWAPHSHDAWVRSGGSRAG